MSPRPATDTDDPLGILVAVRDELTAVCSHLSHVETLRGPHRIYSGRVGGRAVLVTASGMGPERASDAAAALLATHCVTGLVIAGFAGGLLEGAPAGDLVIATSVCDATDDADLRTLPPPDPRLLGLARQAALEVGWCHTGAIVTRRRAEATSAGKRELASRVAGAAAVDMETAAAARAAVDAGVPWVAVRAITDGVGDALPAWLDRCVVRSTGEMSRLKVAAGAIVRPWDLPALVALGARSTRAAGNLAAFIETLIRATRQTNPPPP